MTGEANVRALIYDEMAEAGIIAEDRSTHIREHAGRTFLVSLVVFDITESKEEAA